MNVGTSCMRHLPRYASVACTANSRSHSPKTYIVAMIQEGYFCSLCLFKKLATLSLMPLPTPEFLPSSLFLCFFWFIWFFVWNGCKKKDRQGPEIELKSIRLWGIVTQQPSSRICSDVHPDLGFTHARNSDANPQWNGFKWHVNFSNFRTFNVLQSYSLTCSLIGTKAYGHGMSSNLELDFFQNPSECATLGIYLRIFQHLQAGEISDSKSFSQFSNKTPSFNTFNTYFQHIHIIPYPIWFFFSVQISSFQRSKFRWVGWTLPNLRSDQTHRLQLAPCARNHCQTIPEPPGFLGKHIIQTDSAGWKNNRMFVESLQCRLIMVICQGRVMTNTLERHFLKIWLQVTNTISTI